MLSQKFLRTPPRRRRSETTSCSHTLVSPILDPVIAMRRRVVVLALFRYFEDIRGIDNGYAYKFRWSKHLLRRLGDYLLFEGRHSPELSFMITTEPDGKAVWLQVREATRDHPDVTSTSISAVPSLA